MKALILNSGLGSRMGELTAEHPKCMTEVSFHETILSRQLKQLADYGIEEAVITTGVFENILVNYCYSLGLPIHFTFVKNPEYDKTNYIYSIYCAKEYLDDDILLMHGDLVFENEVLERVLESPFSCMTVSFSRALSEKDFKAVVKDGRVWEVGTGFFTDAVEARPLYRLRRDEWKLWLDKITEFCENGKKNVYAEDALNELHGACRITALDIRNLLCEEIDNAKDLETISRKLKEVQSRKVYMCFSSDILHGGHIAIIRKAQRLGKLIIGVLSDEAVASYKRMPLVSFEDRKTMLENISGVSQVVEQKTLSYKDNLERYHPDIVVHGDDWVNGFQRPVRDETVCVLASYGGKLVEYPYSSEDRYRELEKRMRSNAAMPDIRRGRLRRELGLKGLVTAMEAHDGLTGLVVENTAVYQNGAARQFDAIWISSLCDSTAKGKPDIELVDMTSRFRTIEDIMEVTTKPVIFDGDTGGKTEHFVYTVRTLERLGVSMVIIEDKTGLKKNSLFGIQISQTQDSISNFCEKIRAGKKAQKTGEFMICARIESLILEQGMDDALERAFAFTDAGADAVMIHSRKKQPDEIYEFLEKFRKRDKRTPVVLVPTSFDSVTEEEFKAHGANIIIYANQLMRAAVPAIQNAAKMILENHRAKECGSMLMPFQDIIRFIPAEELCGGGVFMKEQKILFVSPDYKELGRWLKENQTGKIFLVCGRFIRFFTVNDYLHQFCKKEGIEIVRFDDFAPNPLYESAVKGAELFRARGCDCMIAIGGGSAMDVAKCIKLFSTMDSGTNYLEQEKAANHIPFLAMPATAGTGSESTRYAVIYFEGAKQSVTDNSMIPEMVLLDADMLETLPLYQRKATLLDALCHAAESFWSLNSTAQSREYSRKALELVMANMDGYLAHDRRSSRNMLIAANLAGRAINIAQTTAGHAMCYKITSLFGIAHGHAAALCNRKLFAWMVRNTGKCIDPRGEKYLKDVFLKIGQAMGCRSAQAAAGKLEAVFEKLELEVPQASAEQFEILRNSVNTVRLENHPAALDNQTIDMLYHEILR